MRLTELNPKWNVDPDALVVGDRPEMTESEESDENETEVQELRALDGSRIIGLSFDCPCCVGTPKAVRLGIFFDNPIGKTTIIAGPDVHLFHRRGESFEWITIASDIDASLGGHWKGFIRGGSILNAD